MHRSNNYLQKQRDFVRSFQEYRNHGYATEALEEVMKIAFSNGRNPILVIDYDNIDINKSGKKSGLFCKI